MDSLLFYFFSLTLLFCAIRTVTHRHPVYGALYLAGAMITLAGLFFLLGAFFIAGVQLAVYAGAVIVLFVMVLMLFDLKEEEKPFLFTYRLGMPLFLFGIIAGAVVFPMLSFVASSSEPLKIFGIKEMALKLFTKYLLIFEVLGLLLLLIAVGVVSLTRLEKDNVEL